MNELIERIICMDTAGNTYEVEIWQEQIRVGYEQASYQTIPGPQSMILSTGGKVNYVDAETFQVAQTGRLIKRV